MPKIFQALLYGLGLSGACQHLQHDCDSAGGVAGAPLRVDMAAEWLRRQRKQMALTCRCFC